MLTHKHIAWLFLAVFASSIVLVLTSRYISGRAAVQPQPTRIKVLRKKSELGSKPTTKEIQDDQPPAPDERILEDQIPKHVPLQIKIRKEKERGFKDLKNQKWLRDFELEVKNTGTKPIYFLELIIDMADIQGPDGNGVAYALMYGRSELISTEAELKP